MTPTLPPALRTRLGAVPDLAAVAPADLDAIAARLSVQRLPSGARFVTQGVRPAGLAFVLEGEVRLSAGERTVDLVDAPIAIGLPSLVDGAPATASAWAFGDVLVATLPRAAFEELLETSPSFLQGIVEAFDRRVDAAERRADTTRHGFDDHFHSPNARLVQGPYVMADYPMTALVVQADPERVGTALPPGVRAMPGTAGRYLLSFSDFTAVYSEHPAAGGEAFAYRETTLFVPVLGPSLAPAAFCPEMYLDAYMPVVLGRELYGFPKRFGATRFGDRRIDVLLGGRLAFRAGWSGARAVDAGTAIAAVQCSLLGGVPRLPGHARLARALFGLADRPALRERWPPLPVLVHNRAPDGRSHGTALRFDELVEIPFHVRRVGSFELLDDATLTSFDDWLLPGRALCGLRLRMEATFGRAHRPADLRATAPVR